MATCSALPSHPSIKRRARFTATRASRRACRLRFFSNQLHKDQEHVLGVPDAAFFSFCFFFQFSACVLLHVSNLQWHLRKC